MKTTIAILLIIATIFLPGCAFLPPEASTPSGNVVSRKYDISNFDSIDAGSAFEVVVTQADSYNLTITADSELFNDILVEKQGSTLKIGIRTINFVFKTPSKAEISLPDLKKLTLSGASHGTANGVASSSDMAIDLSGASRLEINGTATADVKADLSGASRLSGRLQVGGKVGLSASGASQCTLSGTAAGDGMIDGSAASSFDLANLALPNVSIKLSGASSATVSTSGRLNVDLSGASHLKYLDNPGINAINMSGGSSIEKG